MTRETIKGGGRKVRVWWIDDDHSNKESDQARLAKLLNRDPRLRVDAIPPTRLLEDLIDSQKPKPDLFLVDYKLNSRPDQQGKRFQFTGTAVAGPLRDRFPEHPIYLVSRLITKEQAGDGTELFDRVLVHRQLTEAEGKNILIDDAQDFREIRKLKNRRSIAGINRLFKTPPSSKDRIEKALPDDLRNGIGQATMRGLRALELTYRPSGAVRFARWVRRVLLLVPGILYDDLYAATFLGMSEKYFKDNFIKKIQGRNLMESPLYRGIFYRTSVRVWWKSSLSIVTYSLPEAKGYTVSKLWEDAPKIFKVPRDKAPLCGVCRKPYPETVGYDRHDPNRRAPVHWRCSEADPNRQPLPQFEQIRLLKTNHG